MRTSRPASHNQQLISTHNKAQHKNYQIKIIYYYGATYFVAWVEHFGLLLTAPLFINYINLSGLPEAH